MFLNKNIPLLDRCLIAATIAIVSLFVLITLLSPIVFDTDHFSDTIFILGSAWRSYSGLVPAVDFGHFYGGTTSSMIALAFKIFGVNVKAIDYAQILVFLFFSGCIAYLAFTKVSKITTSFLLLLVATLVFTRFPLEIGLSITGVHSTHSFIYNRLGLASLPIILILCSFKGSERKLEIIDGLLIGALLVFTLFLKFSFIVLAPAVFIALLIQGRFITLLACILSVAIIIMLMGSMAGALQGSYNYVMASIGDRPEASIGVIIKKAAQVFAAHPLALALTMGALIALWDNLASVWKKLLGTAAIIGAGFAVSATMGEAVNIGHMAIPLFAACILVAYEISVRQSNQYQHMIKLCLTFMMLSLSLPHLGNSTVSSLMAVIKKDQMLFQKGPLAGYLSAPSSRMFYEQNATQYEMLAEGVEVLSAVENIQEMGIVADNLISFEFAMQSKPVADYPLWMRESSAEFVQNKGISASADIVMISRHPYGRSGVGNMLFERIQTSFSLCQQTKNWDIFVRNQIDLTICSKSF